MFPTSAIRFNVPDGCRSFTLFPRLPPEMRHRVWMAYLESEQGANFVKFNVSDEGHEAALRPFRPPPDNFAPDEADEIIRLLRHHDDVPRGVVDTILAATYPEPWAEVSHHALLRHRLLIMAATCGESRALVKSLLARPGVLRLDSGTLVSLDRSSDLLVLDYYPPGLYKSSGTLDVDLVCPRLDTVRRLAVRFSPFWRPWSILERICNCGKHQEVDVGNQPTHLYQLLARNFPNLREFYLIDYFIVPQEGQKVTCLNHPGNSTSHVFRSRDRIFHDVAYCDPSTGPWKMEAKPRRVLDWLRHHFIRYASASSTSRHKDPCSVYFGLLACEWKISSPTARRGHSSSQRSHRRGQGRSSERHVEDRTQSRGVRQATPGSGSHSRSEGSASAAGTRPGAGAQGPGTRAASKLSSSIFVFGSGCGDGYEFTFSQPYPYEVSA
ncbi:hypothetical protein CP532_3156 [Ophiocordyceps camponoti-leonardi (nom. inval.)]|nr:hypothetical protein CP532_3156 [Ophiocordyceps camponoti-leonardi (nom. inval.)]